ncbi:MAG TPA: hypothetical protein VFV75_12255 [Candidatus Polarisedimenticolaceae bacterium]|nr:hypothetical protein [Candidatus Polarisedimenticolaceae bacterium]
MAPVQEVEMDPAAWRGEDPQLQAGIDWVLKKLRENPPAKGMRPPYPRYHQPPSPAVGGGGGAP